jgi:hypothetical protein
VMNSRLSKWIVLPGARPTRVGWLSLVMNESFVDGTNGASKGITHRKSPFMVRQLLVFFAPARYRVVKIVYFCSEVVL